MVECGAPAPAADHFTSSSSGVYRASASRDRGDSIMEPMQFLGVMQQELEHQRQLMELMQQMQQQMRQMQATRSSRRVRRRRSKVHLRVVGMKGSHSS